MSDPTKLQKPELPKRFYTSVTVGEVEGGFTALLDGRGIRTPLRRPLVVPSRAVAQTMAVEWEAQIERVDPATMPTTRLANTVVDGIADTVAEVRDDLARYVETDLLFYRAGEPERLVQRQRLTWDPILRWAESDLGVRFLLGEGVMHVAQPVASIAAFRGRLQSASDPFAVAALHQMTTLTGSALIAFAVSRGHLPLDDAWAAAHLDEDWNIELWGADEEASARRAARFADMKAASDLITAVGLLP